MVIREGRHPNVLAITISFIYVLNVILCNPCQLTMGLILYHFLPSKNVKKIDKTL